MAHHRVKFCGLKKNSFVNWCKSWCRPICTGVITSQIIFGKYTFPNVTELCRRRKGFARKYRYKYSFTNVAELGRRKSFVRERDNGRRLFPLLLNHLKLKTIDWGLFFHNWVVILRKNRVILLQKKGWPVLNRNFVVSSQIKGMADFCIEIFAKKKGGKFCVKIWWPLLEIKGMAIFVSTEIWWPRGWLEKLGH